MGWVTVRSPLRSDLESLHGLIRLSGWRSDGSLNAASCPSVAPTNIYTCIHIYVCISQAQRRKQSANERRIQKRLAKEERSRQRISAIQVQAQQAVAKVAMQHTARHINQAQRLEAKERQYQAQIRQRAQSRAARHSAASMRREAKAAADEQSRYYTRNRRTPTSTPIGY